MTQKKYSIGEFAKLTYGLDCFIELMKNISLCLIIQNGLHQIYEDHFPSHENSKCSSSGL
ncbi:hypothetical protein [Metabacillus malikii]|uniref:Uncharacterized protein n=1 Tax=Metabacillus malikii TaxID=1504265 RepID=A0ABT9ZFY0_9BACI|nr:hypothetical protein [Metabacillus malikii]MDQ0231190.1 hypothetical protein [Metabacillus malikii]